MSTEPSPTSETVLPSIPPPPRVPEFEWDEDPLDGGSLEE